MAGQVIEQITFHHHGATLPGVAFQVEVRAGDRGRIDIGGHHMFGALVEQEQRQCTGATAHIQDSLATEVFQARRGPVRQYHLGGTAHAWDIQARSDPQFVIGDLDGIAIVGGNGVGHGLGIRAKSGLMGGRAYGRDQQLDKGIGRFHCHLVSITGPAVK